MYIPRCLYIPNQRSASRRRIAKASQLRLLQASAFRQGLLTEIELVIIEMTIELGLGIESLGLFNDLFDERLESGRFDVYFIVINVTIVEREAEDPHITSVIV